MFKDIQEMISYCKDNKVETINFKVVDFSGKWHRLSITSSKLSEDIMEKGIGFDGSSYGFLTIEKSDMVMIPDVTNAKIATVTIGSENIRRIPSEFSFLVIQTEKKIN